MQSWSRPEVPHLPEAVDGGSSTLQIFDTSSARLEDFTPEQAEARLYVCGITPYDATHLGHAATYLTFDLLQRQWLDTGHEVHYVQNVTDVDDPLLERAKETGQHWAELAEDQTQLFREDMAALRILPPRDFIGAVESIPLVVEMVERLSGREAVYPVDDDLYFSVHADPAFGEVSGYDTEMMLQYFGERGGDPERMGKRHALDCLLWQAERPEEPSWDSALGRGRPGWHIECAAIAMNHLGTEFDVQGGGSDLIFPHHEMSASQAAVDSGRPFARRYLHAGMVEFEGEKMSKSKGNLVLVSRLRETGHDPMVLRLALLSHHYREDWEWFDSELETATERLTAWRDGFERASGPDADQAIAQVRAALRDDLDAPKALAVVDEWSRSEGTDGTAPARMATAVDALLGVNA